MKKVTGYEMLGKRMKECRLEMGMSVEETADKLGMKPVTHRGYEAGKRIIRGDKLVAMARLFRVSCDYLVGRTDVKWMPFND